MHCVCRLQNKGITHVLIVRSTLERRLDPKFPVELKYQIVEVGAGQDVKMIVYQSSPSSSSLIKNY